MSDRVVEMMQDITSEINKSQRKLFPFTDITERELILRYR